MKKMIIALLVVCLLAGGVVGFLSYREQKSGVIGGADGPT